MLYYLHAALHTALVLHIQLYLCACMLYLYISRRQAVEETSKEVKHPFLAVRRARRRRGGGECPS
jgi:hypothetical protein